MGPSMVPTAERRLCLLNGEGSSGNQTDGQLFRERFYLFYGRDGEMGEKSPAHEEHSLWAGEGAQSVELLLPRYEDLRSYATCMQKASQGGK